MTEANAVPSAWRAFFWAACGFNLLIGLAGMLSPAATIDARIAGLFIFAFGVLYFLIARDPLRFAPVLWAGVLVKVGKVALLAPEAFSVDGSGLIAAILLADVLFAVGFLAFLFTHGEDSAS